MLSLAVSFIWFEFFKRIQGAASVQCRHGKATRHPKAFFKPIRRKRITHFLKSIPAFSVPFQRGDQVFNDAVSDDKSKVFPRAHSPYPLKRGI
jgi:hypothetical protein